MAQQTYRQMVNKAILESGVTLDDIGTGTSFLLLPMTRCTRFKTWIADSWKEVQMMYSELDFTIKQNLAESSTSYLYRAEQHEQRYPAAGAVIIKATSGTKFAVGRKIDNSTADIHLLSGVWASGTAKAFIGLTTEGSATLVLTVFRSS